nr:MAG TPA: hypothetical protein [Caudoviricetes sp.]
MPEVRVTGLYGRPGSSDTASRRCCGFRGDEAAGKERAGASALCA